MSYIRNAASKFGKYAVKPAMCMSLLFGSACEMTDSFESVDISGDGAADCIYVVKQFGKFDEYSRFHIRAMTRDPAGNLGTPEEIACVSGAFFSMKLKPTKRPGAPDISIFYERDRKDHKVIYTNDGYGNFKFKEENVSDSR